ncbi:MAG: DUF86 domain-containing protein [Verrucomicrobiota bacterium]|nr:DUF86 domain-containing protein [Verrucomicrobiota bacterium]
MRWLPEKFKVEHTEIVWVQISALRNRIVHDYSGLDLKIIWHVLRVSLPDFKQLDKLMT